MKLHTLFENLLLLFNNHIQHASHGAALNDQHIRADFQQLQLFVPIFVLYLLEVNAYYVQEATCP